MNKQKLIKKLYKDRQNFSLIFMKTIPVRLFIIIWILISSLILGFNSVSIYTSLFLVFNIGNLLMLNHYTTKKEYKTIIFVSEWIDPFICSITITYLICLFLNVYPIVQPNYIHTSFFNSPFESILDKDKLFETIMIKQKLETLLTIILVLSSNSINFIFTYLLKILFGINLFTDKAFKVKTLFNKKRVQNS